MQTTPIYENMPFKIAISEFKIDSEIKSGKEVKVKIEKEHLKVSVKTGKGKLALDLRRNGGYKTIRFDS